MQKNIYLCDLDAAIKYECGIQVLDSITDYGRPMKTFFIKIPNLWAWANKYGGIWSIFSRFINTRFGTISTVSMISIIQPLFLQKTKPLF